MSTGFHLPAIPPLDEEAMAAARARQALLTKPPGSLGRLEGLSVQLAGITGRLDPSLHHKRVIVCAADHGVVAEGVSASPTEVTAQRVRDLLSGGAAVAVLARQVGAALTVVDLGVAADLPGHPDLVPAKIARGTRNIALGPAMSRAEARQAIATGTHVVNALADEPGLDLVILGGMGDGNTTSAAALAAALTGLPPAEVTDGAGLDEAGLAHKVAVVERALAATGLRSPVALNPTAALDLLARVGGYEVGGLAGVCVAAAARRIPLLVDGFTATSAAALAVGLTPAVQPYLIAAHRSPGRGPGALLAHLGLEPLLDLELRLGEGTGGALAVPLVEAAVALLNEMATCE